jgi:putative DNA primase/helicase
MDVLEEYGARVDAAMLSEMTDGDHIQELASLSDMAYDRVREERAKTLGVRVGTLDKLVAEARAEQTVIQTAAELVSDDEPWSEPVDGDEVVREVLMTLHRHAVLPKGADVAIALWIVGTYGYDAFRIWPKLLLSSPEKRCGKSTLLEIVQGMSHRALIASNITPSAIFRCIDAWRPTLLIDEADTFIHGNEELRGIVNSGHTKSTAYVIRVVGDDHEPKQFSTWAPMVLSMIKLPPDTILDRSILIPMRRKLPGESVTRLPLDFPSVCRHLRSKLLRWTIDHADALKAANPVLPTCGNDRALDNWTPILAIAETIGGKVPAAALSAFEALQTDLEDVEGEGPTILSDLRYLFDGRGKKYLKLSSQEIVDALVEMEDRPWAEWKHGRPLSKNSLARLLKPFKIKSRNIRIGLDTPKGYEREQFNDAFSRYLPPLASAPPFQTATTPQATAGAASSDFQNATSGSRVADEKTLKPTAGAGCGVVADEIPPSRPKGGINDDVRLY